MTEDMAQRAGDLLMRRGWTLAVAESCTGGLLGHMITNIPGSSEYFLGGIIAYAYEVKQVILGVDSVTLETFGAVSEETALEMARGARIITKADIGVSITGIAGPAGESETKPVGLTWIGISSGRGDFVERYVWDGDRISNKEHSALAALKQLIRYLEDADEG